MKALIHKDKKYICYIGTLVSCWDYQRHLSNTFNHPLSDYIVRDISDNIVSEYNSRDREGKLYYYLGV